MSEAETTGRTLAELTTENETLRSLVASMAMLLPLHHMSEDEQRLLGEILGNL